MRVHYARQQGTAIVELVVGRGFPPSLKLRRTTVALAKVVRPCQGGPNTRAIYCRGSGTKRSVGQLSVVAGRRVVRPALRANVDECSLSLRPEGHASLSGRAGRRRLGNLLGVRMTHAFYIGRSPISSSIYGILLMPSAYYPKRTGDNVYDVTVSKDETRRLSRRYCARLSNAERIENGRLVSVQIDVKDAVPGRPSAKPCGRSMRPSIPGVASSSSNVSHGRHRPRDTRGLVMVTVGPGPEIRVPSSKPTAAVRAGVGHGSASAIGTNYGLTSATVYT